MWLRSLTRKSLYDQRWQIAGFGICMFMIAALDVFIWPAYKDQLALIEIPPALEGLIGDMPLNTGAGFLNAEYFSWIILLLLVYAIIQRTGAIAGEESAGTADLLLAQPLSRTELIAAKMLAALAGAIAIVMMGVLGFAISIPFVEIDASVWDTFVASVNMLFVTFLFYGLSLWLGAVAPTRAAAAGGAIAVLVAAYFIDLMAASVEALDWLRYLSPFYYYGRGLPLVNGINWWHAALLTGIGAALCALAVRTFNRRDVTVGGATSMPLRELVRRLAG